MSFLLVNSFKFIADLGAKAVFIISAMWIVYTMNRCLYILRQSKSTVLLHVISLLLNFFLKLMNTPLSQ